MWEASLTGCCSLSAKIVGSVVICKGFDFFELTDRAVLCCCPFTGEWVASQNVKYVTRVFHNSDKQSVSELKLVSLSKSGFSLAFAHFIQACFVAH